MGLILHQHVPHAGHGHSHNHCAPPPEPGQASQHANLNVRAAFIHCVGDLLQSIGVLTAAIIIWFKVSLSTLVWPSSRANSCKLERNVFVLQPEYKVADPICTFIFSALVIGTTVFIIRDTMNVLMESTPKHFDVERIKGQLLTIVGVLDCHNFHVWSLTTGKHVCSVHIVISEFRWL